jgi:hypothetical protein
MTMTPEQTLEKWDEHSHNRAADPRLPSWCPRWCTTNHQKVLDEGSTIEDAKVHYATAGEGILDEIHNIIDKRVTRKGGGTWDVSAEQYLRDLEVVTLMVSDHAVDRVPVTLRLTSGEARIIARQPRAHG